MRGEIPESVCQEGVNLGPRPSSGLRIYGLGLLSPAAFWYNMLPHVLTARCRRRTVPWRIITTNGALPSYLLFLQASSDRICRCAGITQIKEGGSLELICPDSRGSGYEAFVQTMEIDITFPNSATHWWRMLSHVSTARRKRWSVPWIKAKTEGLRQFAIALDRITHFRK